MPSTESLVVTIRSRVSFTPAQDAGALPPPVDNDVTDDEDESSDSEHGSSELFDEEELMETCDGLEVTWLVHRTSAPATIGVHEVKDKRGRVLIAGAKLPVNNPSVNYGSMESPAHVTFLPKHAASGAGGGASGRGHRIMGG